MGKKFLNFFYVFLCVTAGSFAQWESNIVYYEDGAGGSIDNRLTYVSDSEGNHVPDFSHAGYRGGGVALPNIPVKITLNPVAGDNSIQIQNAIDTVETPGAIELLPGDYYEVTNVIHINRSGVVLRGVVDPDFPDDPTKSTIILSTQTFPVDPADPSGRPADYQERVVMVAGGLIFGGAPWPENPALPKTDIITDFVPVGGRSFEVTDSAGFSIGDNIIVVHPSTQAWIDSVDGGGTASDPNWVPADESAPRETFFFNRYITNITPSQNGAIITIDTPVYNQLDRSLSQSYIYLYDRTDIQTEIGVENLKIEINVADDTDYTHAWIALSLVMIEDSWVSNVTATQFTGSGFFTRNASRVTIVDSRAETIAGSGILESQRYNFNSFRATNNLLLQRNHSANASNAFISDGTTAVSGVVALDCTTQEDYESSGGHRKWSMGLLFDNFAASIPHSVNNAINLGLYNRGDLGGSHGWACANSVAWASKVPNMELNMDGDLVTQRLCVQKPPTAQNYAIGCTGTVTGQGPFVHPEGYIEGNTGTLHPRSLYEAQLAERQQHGVTPTPPVIRTIVAGQNSLVLTWLPTLDVTEANLSYEVERFDEGGASYQVIATVLAPALGFTDATAVGNVIYRVRALNGGNGNKSAYSNTFAATAPEPTVTVRHLRFFFPAGQSCYSRIILKEFRTYAIGSNTNFSLKKSTDASSDRGSSYTSDRAVDGRTRTNWSTYNTGNEEWWTVDLATTIELDRIMIKRSSRHFAPLYEIQGSLDGSNWTTIFTQDDNESNTFYVN